MLSNFLVFFKKDNMHQAIAKSKGVSISHKEIFEHFIGKETSSFKKTFIFNKKIFCEAIN